MQCFFASMTLDIFVEELELTFDDICGVQVDVRIPSHVQQFFRKQWEQWRWGTIGKITIPDVNETDEKKAEEIREAHKRAQRGLYLTRYEHLALGKSFYWAPDPFMPLAAQTEKILRDKIPNYGSKKTQLEEIIEERRKQFPPNELILCPLNTLFLPEFYARSKFPYGKGQPLLAFYRPDISSEGRVPIPRVIGVYKKTEDGSKEPFPLSDTVLKNIQFPTTWVSTQSGIKIREVFDYQNGYRIELAK